MIVDVGQESQPDLHAYARVSIAFEVREVMDVTATNSGAARFSVSARPAGSVYVKDYDAMDGGPLAWPARFDLSHWTFFAARARGERVGGAAVVFRAPDIEMVHDRPDVALLWDIRVAPHARGRGVGSALIAAVEAWTTLQGAKWLEVETQNINAPACRFYQRSGFELHANNPGAYRDLPGETQLLWLKRLL